MTTPPPAQEGPADRDHPLNSEATARRRSELRGEIETRYGANAVLLVTDHANLAYLTGFTGSNGLLLLGQSVAELVTDFRYLEQARRQAAGLALVEQRDVIAGALERLPAAAPVVIEADHVSASVWLRLQDAAGPQRLFASHDLVERRRRVKDTAELAAIRAACTIAESALSAVLPDVAVGTTERGLAARLEFSMRLGGAHGIAFPTIVAGGENSAIPHHTPSDRPLARGDLLKIDFGAVVDGYHSDITRTFVVGAEPTQWQSEIHGVVREAQATAAAAARSGAELSSVDAAARSSIAAAGYGERFGHGLGHGVGLQIHEWPIMTPRSAGTLGAGMAVTIEPGIYLPGRGGVRIEDTVVVGDMGPELLTHLPRDLIRVG